MSYSFRPCKDRVASRYQTDGGVVPLGKGGVRFDPIEGLLAPIFETKAK